MDGSERYEEYRQERLRQAVHANDDDAFSLPMHHIPASSVDWSVTERVTVDTPLPRHNKGYAMLLKLRWTEGQGLGRHGLGRVEPVPVVLKEDLLGLGREEHEDEYHQQSTAKRRLLDSEVIEDETRRQEREAKVAREETIRSEISQTLRQFYCDICNKQYHRVAEFESHLSSYDHGHKKRLKEMREAEAARARQNIDEQRRKEKDREERELLLQVQRAAAAAPPAPATTASAAVAPAAALMPETSRPALSFGLVVRPTASAAATKAAPRPRANIFDDDDDE